ncbi:MAG: hypothetical protein IKB02_03295 [Clostridia bacterium]|nr:hypothetical protein [Clostridia bacterium]
MTMNDEILTQVTDETEAVDAEAISVEELQSEADSIPEDEAEGNSETKTDEECTSKENEPSVEEMLVELKKLREELLEKRKVFEKMSRDISEFEELFPEKKVNEIPDTVWESVKGGIPLAAAYALYERKNAIRRDTAEIANTANSARTTGPIGRDATEIFYTPDEVRAMSRSEVRKNYSKILESMKKWN